MNVLVYCSHWQTGTLNKIKFLLFQNKVSYLSIFNVIITKNSKSKKTGTLYKNQISSFSKSSLQSFYLQCYNYKKKVNLKIKDGCPHHNICSFDIIRLYCKTEYIKKKQKIKKIKVGKPIN